MLHNLTPTAQHDTTAPVGLRALVNRLSVSAIPAATSRRSFIINDIPAGLAVNADEQVVATVFGNLLTTLIANTKDCCIRISAKIYGKIALLSIKESHQPNGKSFGANIRQIQQLAASIGGTVSVSYHQRKTTTLIFSFTNNLPLAA